MNFTLMSLSPRKLIPEDQVIVVLDTVVARKLAYSHEDTSWCETFSRMSSRGYSFSLADSTVAELVEQRYRASLSAKDCSEICRKLETFLNPDIPVLLGKVDLGGMLGLNTDPWDADESRELSRAAWSAVTRCADSAAPLDSFNQELKDERNDWIAMYEGWQCVLDHLNREAPDDPIDVNSLTESLLLTMESSQAKWGNLIPPMSVRSHLSNRYHWRQFVRMQKEHEPYNPRANNKINDGIDADLYRYLILPAFIVSEDRGFFGGLADINSFQKKWFFRPHALADEWLQGRNPMPLWP